MSKVVVTIFLGIPRDDENGKDVPSRWINILNSTDTKRMIRQKEFLWERDR